LDPIDEFNFTGLETSEFNYTVDDNNKIDECMLYGDWEGWHQNQTIENPEREEVLSFGSVNIDTDGFYKWNVYCYDDHGNLGWNSTNFTFAAFYPPYTKPEIFEINQSDNVGEGYVNLSWNSVENAVNYKVLYTDNLKNDFEVLEETEEPLYKDKTANQTRRRFYKISAWNPTAENVTEEIFGKTIYNLGHSPKNTRNWIGIYLNDSRFLKADSLLNEINNITSINMWDENIQKRVICNSFSCPDYPECTSTNCNFDLENGRGYEVNVNTSASSNVNWSLVGRMNDKANITLIKNVTGFGKNWISIHPKTLLENAEDLLNNISYSTAVTNWNTERQTSEGLIFVPAWGLYVGKNFEIEIEKGYEVSVSQNTNWKQQ